MRGVLRYGPGVECVSTAGTLRFGLVDVTRVHAYDATVVSAVHKKVSSDELSSIPISTTRLANQVAADWLHEALVYRKKNASCWAFCVRQTSHLSSVALHHADALAEAGGEAVHLQPPTTHVQLLLPTLDGRILTSPVTEAALTSCQSQRDEVDGRLHRGHTLMGRASGLSLRPSQFLHTPAFRSLCKAGDNTLPVIKSLRHRLQRRDGRPVDKYPCIFCGGLEEDVPHMVLCFWGTEESNIL